MGQGNQSLRRQAVTDQIGIGQSAGDTGMKLRIEGCLWSSTASQPGADPARSSPLRSSSTFPSPQTTHAYHNDQPILTRTLLDRFSDAYPNARFYKIDVDEVPDVAQELGIRAMPTFVLFKNGEKVGEVVGANPKALEAAIQQNL